MTHGLDTSRNLPRTVEGAAEPPEAALARALRDLEQTRTRIEKNAERVYDEKRRELVRELLPVLDNLDRALAAPATASDRAIVDGVQMVRAELEGVLVRFGVERVDVPVGQRFDPTMHEAVSAVAVIDPMLVGTVVRQAAPGYHFAGKLLRAAKVSVGTQSRPRGRPTSALASPW